MVINGISVGFDLERAVCSFFGSQTALASLKMRFLPVQSKARTKNNLSAVQGTDHELYTGLRKVK